MKKVLFAFATLLFVACGNKVQQPELVEEDISLPEYKLLSTEEPKVSSNGIISPGQNLVYNIEIDHAIEKDSLELLQDYFIQKGEADFAGINKIIVRAYLKGTSIHGTPYASLNLVAGKKDIMINEGAEDKTGFFNIQGGSPSTFTWKRSGNNVTILYEAFGEQKLKFDQSAKTLTEKSESFGTLVFNKQ